MDGEPAHDRAGDSFLPSGGKADIAAVTDGTADARAVLRVANGASYATLRGDVGLYGPAATHLVAYRAGADGVLGTADDRTIATLAELDSIPYIGPVSFQELVTYATSLTWQDWLPAQLSSSLAITVPVTVRQWSSITPSDPSPGTPGTPSTRTVTLALSRDAGGVHVHELQTGTATAAADGTFTLSYQDSGVTADQRNVYGDTDRISGRFDPRGEVVITAYDFRSYGGNSIYGYKGTTTEQAGEAYTGLPFVEPSAR